MLLLLVVAGYDYQFLTMFIERERDTLMLQKDENVSKKLYFENNGRSEKYTLQIQWSNEFNLAHIKVNEQLRIEGLCVCMLLLFFFYSSSVTFISILCWLHLEMVMLCFFYRNWLFFYAWEIYLFKNRAFHIRFKILCLAFEESSHEKL